MKYNFSGWREERKEQRIHFFGSYPIFFLWLVLLLHSFNRQESNGMWWFKQKDRYVHWINKCMDHVECFTRTHSHIEIKRGPAWINTWRLSWTLWMISNEELFQNMTDMNTFCVYTFSNISLNLKNVHAYWTEKQGDIYCSPKLKVQTLYNSGQLSTAKYCERHPRVLQICVSAASVDLVGQGELGTAGWYEHCGKSATYQTRSEEGQLLIKTFLLQCSFGISTCTAA